MPSSCEPMRLRASAAPIDAPTPAVPPAPIAAEAAATVACIPELLAAAIATLPALTSLLASTCAFTLVRMTLVDSAPAPLSAMPAVPAMAADADAAAESASIVAVSCAVRLMAPLVLVTVLSAFLIAASTSFAMVFRASATPMDSDTAPVPASDTASDAAPAAAAMVEVSCAVKVTLPAWMPVAPSPST